MIIIGEIIAYDIGDHDIILHVKNEYDGVYYKCIADPTYGPAIRLLTKNNNRVELTGEIRERETYHTPKVLQEVFILSRLRQLMPGHEDYGFFLTGAIN
jgi:hypothetical protein